MSFDEKKPARVAGQGVERASHGAHDPDVQELPNVTSKYSQHNIPTIRGLLGETSHWALSTAPRPVWEIALATAIAILSALMGRCFNVKGQGLNQYVLVIGHTGSGKDLCQAFPEAFYSALRPSVPMVDAFRGVGEIGSAQGLLRSLADKPFGLATFGEIGMMLVAMTKHNASPHLVGILRFLLSVYSKSGRGNAIGSTVYSDAQKNTAVVERPAVSIIGETTPELFYNGLDDGLITSGLIPRFLTFAYNGPQVALSKSFDTYQCCCPLIP